MLRSRAVWIGILLVAVGIHLDWHLAREGPAHWSFGLSFHWVLAFLTFAPLSRLALRARPEDASRTAAVMILLGSSLGQILEPLVEMLIWPGSAPFADQARWAAFTAFFTAGVLTHLVSQVLFGRRRPTQP